MKYVSHPLKYITPLPDLKMICYFKDGTIKIFDFHKVIERYPQFKALENDEIFNNAYVDLGGLCITFNEDLDISEETLYQHGVVYNIKAENKKILKTVYNYCKEARKKSNITQKQLSMMSKIPQSGIARIESGNNDIQVGTLINYLAPLGYEIKIVKK